MFTYDPNFTILASDPKRFSRFLSNLRGNRVHKRPISKPPFFARVHIHDLWKKLTCKCAKFRGFSNNFEFYLVPSFTKKKSSQGSSRPRPFFIIYPPGRKVSGAFPKGVLFSLWGTSWFNWDERKEKMRYLTISKIDMGYIN